MPEFYQSRWTCSNDNSFFHFSFSFYKKLECQFIRTLLSAISSTKMELPMMEKRAMSRGQSACRISANDLKHLPLTVLAESICSLRRVKSIRKKHGNCHRTYSTGHRSYSWCHLHCFLKANISNKAVTILVAGVLAFTNHIWTQLRWYKANMKKVTNGRIIEVTY